MSDKKEIQDYTQGLIVGRQTKWQNREEWFFNREHTDTYEDYYEGPYKRAEKEQKLLLSELVKRDARIGNILEFGCGTTRFTRWWKEIGIDATGGDISPFMLSQALHRFDGDLVMGDSHYLPFKEHSFDALAFITTFEYYRDPVKVLREAARVGKYGIIMGMMNRNTPKLIRRRTQQAFGRNPFYVTATFYTPRKLTSVIDEALAGRKYSLAWRCTGLPGWFPVRSWKVPYGDFFGMHIQFDDV